MTIGIIPQRSKGNDYRILTKEIQKYLILFFPAKNKDNKPAKSYLERWHWV